MGQWSAEYCDDVLKMKMKSMVSGAIKRSKLAKTDPKITYERFVEDLDAGDSFTTSLVDTLVKELAERRTRQSINDRRFISERTAKELRQMAAPNRIFRDFSYGAATRRHNPARRAGNFAGYINHPPDEIDLEEDSDEFDGMLDSALEGARVNSDLHEAYGSHSGWGNAGLIFSTRRSRTSPTPPMEDPGVQTTVSSPPGLGRHSTLPPNSSAATLSASAAALTRQPSIRRPVRSRTVDFNDFTSRRRSSLRETLASRAEDGGPPQRESPEPPITFASRPTIATRRFFPFGRSYRNENTWGSLWNDPSEDTDEGRSGEPTPSSGSLPPFMETGTAYPLPPRDPETSDERTPSVSVPRLRRGGLRPPESLRSRHDSPSIVHMPGTPETEAPDYILFGNSHRRGEDDSYAPVAYPTPGSVEGDSTPASS